MYNQSPNILCKNFHLEAKIPSFDYIHAYLSHILQRLITSTMLNYEVHMDNNSLYNTPPVFGVYIVGLVAKWLKKQGGLKVMQDRNIAKANLIYAVIDSHSDFYCGFSEKASRSYMNVTFGLSTVELENQFVLEANAIGLNGLKGHRSVGGLRASIYNAMPRTGCEKLAEFMEKFYKNNK